MNNLEAIELLTKHNKWRRGDNDIEPTDPKQLGLAIERAIAVMSAAEAFYRAKGKDQLLAALDSLEDALLALEDEP